jgi:uncharacterized damage-inducible protein DinB
MPDSKSDPLAILLGYNRWATALLLDLCRRIPDEKFHQAFDMGCGTLHDTFGHTIGAMLRWVDRIYERDIRPSIEKPQQPGGEKPRRTPEQFLEILDRADRELREVVAWSRDKGLDTTVNLTFGEKSFTFTRGVAIMHILNHGTHHRAQAMNMLRRVNVPGVSDNLPDIDVADWSESTPSPSTLDFGELSRVGEG